MCVWQVTESLLNFTNCSGRYPITSQFVANNSLIKLDLSYNELFSVPEELFPLFPMLVFLSLRGNPITKVRMSEFKLLHRLEYLDLSYCQISQLQLDLSLPSSSSLSTLLLSGNLLSHIEIPDNNFQLLATIMVLSLVENPWHCDCKLLGLRRILGYKPNHRSPKCSLPTRLEGRLVTDLPQEEFACVPSVSPSYVYLNMELGKDVLFLCKIAASPSATITWKFNGVQISKENPRLKVRSTSIGNKEIHSELFISNVSLLDNGTFHCAAENLAGATNSQFVLNVTEEKAPWVKIEIKEVELKALVLLFVTSLILVFVILVILLLKLLMTYCSNHPVALQHRSPCRQRPPDLWPAVHAKDAFENEKTIVFY